MITQNQIIVPTGVVRVRLEEFLFDRFPNLSRMYLRDLIRNEKCEVNGKIENKGKRISAGDFIEVELELDRESAMRPQEMALDILFEDDSLLVVNKPAGILVHPTHRERNGTLLNALVFYLNESARSEPTASAGGQKLRTERDEFAITAAPSAYADGSAYVRPGLVHRLDKETSGLLVVTKNTPAHRILASQFRKKTVEKKYIALVEGVVEAEKGTVETPIGRFAEKKRWDVKADGKLSITRFWVRERFIDTTLLELEPVTGRTNQLRIHCEEIGHPIVGDVSRGGREFGRLCLHAYGLEFTHPQRYERLKLETSLPPEFKP